MINNRNFQRETALRPPVQRTCIYRAEEGAAFSHHPYLCRFRGRFYAMWSGGAVHEDDVGQRAVIAWSDDFLHWSKPLPLTATNDPSAVDTACGMIVWGDTLYLYVGSYRYDEAHIGGDGHRVFADSGHTGTHLYVLTSKDGRTFSPARRTGLNMVPNMPPRILSDGIAVICGNFLMPVNRNFPDGTWELHGLSTQCDTDDSETFYAVSRSIGLDTAVCECDILERENGYTALFRSQSKEHSGVLYASESADLVDWSLPHATEFTNDTSKFHVGRLSDGRYYWLGNPLVGNGRDPLALSLSEDGENFTRHIILGEGKRSMRCRGFAKFGAYGYPYSFEEDGWFSAVWSVNKEDIEACRIGTAQL